MAKLIHSMVRVLNEKHSVEFYENAFGLKVADRYQFDTFTILYMSNTEAEFELELTINHGRADPYDIGDGYGHIAFLVNDISTYHRRFTDLGMSPTAIKKLICKDEFIGQFFFVQDPDNYKIEVLGKYGRYR